MMTTPGLLIVFAHTYEVILIAAWANLDEAAGPS
jgi:hypothetical protein